MRYNTLNSLFTAICNAIRAKDGTTAPIDHQDIPDRIAAIENTGITVRYRSGGRTVLTRIVQPGTVVTEGFVPELPENVGFLGWTDVPNSDRPKTITAQDGDTEIILYSIRESYALCTIEGDNNSTPVGASVYTLRNVSLTHPECRMTVAYTDNNSLSTADLQLTVNETDRVNVNSYYFIAQGSFVLENPGGDNILEVFLSRATGNYKLK